ncbi:XRE family transcriptional regulator [Enterococcus sp. BWM-S5]|uniref:XRE family transcriptional regulator n=1 Tax=Enterococcus larvae TaxID=2794352 RepID=A0ABS4CII7_9ENTE|nr:XRE family transcriptional regulator [Enterococcus larvae]MBP1046439.1 XRE family transcriptional regulator [Enterococcus larvae]
MNKIKLKSVIVLNNDTQNSLAASIGISPQTLSSKINERQGSEFTQTEIKTIKEKYSLSAEEVDEIFFNNFVSLKDTKQTA